MQETSERTVWDQITVRDWMEDFADEDNGRYFHTCADCKEMFFGHKRRMGVCKKCWVRFAEQIVIKNNIEKFGQIEWLTDLKDTILEKRLDDAVDNITAAIKLLTTEHGRSKETSGTSRP